MHGAFRSYAFYGYKRIIAQAPYFAIPLAIGEHRQTSLSITSVCSLTLAVIVGYGILSWGMKKNAYLNSKEGHRLHGGAV